MEYKIIYKSYNTKHEVETDRDKLRKECISILDSCGWDDKQCVDLRSIKSMAKYVYENLEDIVKI